jgi:phosphoribosyl 1,2-cyclic phosphodiesterase
MKVNVLASGSRGNATIIEKNGDLFLIDCGISYLQLKNRLESQNHSLENLKGIFITHEHGDHVSGIVTLLKHFPVPVFLSKGTFEGLNFKIRDNIDQTLINLINSYQSVVFNTFSMLPFSVSHDASDAMGFIFTDETSKMVYVSDIGYLPKSDMEILKGATAYFFECNYDVTTLFTSNRTYHLKQRIDGIKGHMSNTDCAYNLSQLINDNTRHIIALHRSQDCNSEADILETITKTFKDYELELNALSFIIAKQDVPTGWLQISSKEII